MTGDVAEPTRRLQGSSRQELPGRGLAGIAGSATPSGQVTVPKRRKDPRQQHLPPKARSRGSDHDTGQPIMDVGHVGPGGINRNSGRHQKVDPGKSGAEGRDQVTDQASISDDSRESLAVVEAMSEELKQDDPIREERVREVREKLQRGELEQPKVFRAVADAILDVEY